MVKNLTIFLFLFLTVTSAYAITRVPATDITVNSTSFSQNLSTSDNTVQKALQTLDQTIGNAGNSTPGGVDTQVQMNNNGTLGGANIYNVGGNVGINTLYPAYQFDVNGTLKANRIFGIQAIDVPILNQNTTGTASNVTGTVAINRGGTGQTTQQTAINALTGTQISGRYLRSDGSNATLSSIQASDIPTLNQNTTGNAATVTTNANLTGPITSVGNATTISALAVQNTNVNWSSLSGDINKEGINWTSFPSSGFVKFNGSSSPTADTNTYLTGNQTVTLSGDISGSGTTAITTTLGALKVQSANINWSNINGIAPIAATGVNWSSFPATGFMKFNGSSTPTADTNSYITTSLTADSALVGNAGGVATATAIGSCSGGTNALTYNTTNHTFGCNTISASGTPGGSTNQIQYNSGGSFAGGANTGIDANGNVGIGTGVPNTPLNVKGYASIIYSGADSPGVYGTPFIIDASSSSITNAPGFSVKVPATGLQKAFQLLKGSDTTAWASYEYNVGGTGKPGFALGSGSVARDTNIYRNAADVLKTDDTLVVGTNIGIGTDNPPNRFYLASGTAEMPGFKLNTNAGSGHVLVSNSVGVGTWQNPTTLPTSITLTTTGSSGAATLTGNTLNIPQYSGGGTNIGIGTANTLTYWPTTDTIGSLATSTYPSLTEVSYVKGVTSAIQTQLDGKQASGSYLTGNQTITLSGDISGSGATSIATTLGALKVQTGNVNWSSLSGNINKEGVNWTSFPVSGFMKFNGSSSPTADTSTYLTAETNTLTTMTGIADDQLALGSGTGTGTYVTIPNCSDANGNHLNYVQQTNSFSCGTSGGNASPAGGLNAVQYNSPLGTLAGNEALFSFNGTNVGIGTTNGLKTLDVNGTTYFRNNVGIGSVNPTQALDVNGTIKTTGIQLTTNPSAGYILTSTSTGIGTWMPNTATGGATVGGSQNAIQYNNASALAGSDTVFGFNGTNVGLGTTSYTNRLNIVGSVGISTLANSSYVTSTATSPTALLIDGNVGIGTFQTTPGKLVVGGSVVAAGTGDSYFNVTSGNVGIGTLTPDALLSITSTANQDLFRVNDSGYGDTSAFVIDAGGNVGVGSPSPTAKVDISGNIASTGNLTLGSYGTISFAGSLNGSFNGGSGTVSINNLSSADGSGLLVKGRDANAGTSGGVTIRGGEGNAASGQANYLVLRGGDASSNTAYLSSTPTTLRGSDVTATANNTPAGDLYIRPGGTSTTSGTNGKLQLSQTFLATAGNFAAKNDIACLTASNTVGDCPTSATNALGVGIGTTNPGIVQIAGIATHVPFDGTYSPSAGWYACTSATTAGKVLPQSTACTAGRQIGIITQDATSVGIGTFMVQVK